MLYSDNNSMFFSDNYIMSAIFFNYLLFKKGYHMHMKKSLYQTIQYLTDSSSDLLTAKLLRPTELLFLPRMVSQVIMHYGLGIFLIW